MIPKTVVTICAALQLTGHQPWMDLQGPGESDDVSLCEERCFPGDKTFQRGPGYAKVCSRFVGHALIFGHTFTDARALALEFGVEHDSGSPVLSEDVFNLVTQDEPKIIYSIITQRHADHWRG